MRAGGANTPRPSRKRVGAKGRSCHSGIRSQEPCLDRSSSWARGGAQCCGFYHRAQDASLASASFETSAELGGSEFDAAGSANVTNRLFFSRVIVRESTDRKSQPETASPTCKRRGFFVVSSITTATLFVWPVAVPRSVRSGSSSAGGGGAGLSIKGVGAGGGIRGRRVAVKTGRSRVAVRALRGTAQSGFAL